MNWLREYAIPAVVTVLLHTGLLLWLGMDFVSKPKLPDVPEPKFVKASIVRLKEQAAPKPVSSVTQAQRQAEIKRQQEQKRQQELKRQQEQKRLEQQKQEKLKAEQAAKERQKAEQARKQAELERQKAEQERQQLEQQKQAQKRQEQQRALEQKAREEALLNSIREGEQAAQNSAANEQKAQSYAAIIQQTVIANWSRPASARNGMEVLLDIQLVPNGTVVNVNIVKGSGNDAFDRSAVAAVKKAERFPELAGMESSLFEQYFRHFSMRFRPEDLRL